VKKDTNTIYHKKVGGDGKRESHHHPIRRLTPTPETKCKCYMLHRNISVKSLA